MKTLMLKGDATPADGYFISDFQHNKTFRQQALTPERLFELIWGYKEQGFDAIGVWDERDNTYVDALTYTATPLYGQFVYDIKIKKHYTY